MSDSIPGPDGERYVDPTPVYISETAVRYTLPTGPDGPGYVTVHDRSGICHYVDDDSIPTFVEFIEESIGDRSISIRACDHCGGRLDV